MYFVIGNIVSAIAIIYGLGVLLNSEIWESREKGKYSYKNVKFKAFFLNELGKGVLESFRAIVIFCLAIFIGLPLVYSMLTVMWPLTLLLTIALAISIHLDNTKNKNNEEID